MRPDIAVVLGNGIKDFADAMTDVVPYDEFQEKQGQDNPYNREGKIEIIEAMINRKTMDRTIGKHGRVELLREEIQHYESERSGQIDQRAIISIDMRDPLVALNRGVADDIIDIGDPE